MQIDEILKEYKIRLIVFDNELFPRDGAYFPPERTIFINNKLSKEERERLILHELGHINHNPELYSRLLFKFENEAERFMIRELIKKYLKTHDVIDFNWLKFAETNKISSTWGQQMILEEFKKLI
ncbi:cI-like repressor [Streptococcus bovimastitidis]|uniref:CI-like repressor n=1 Tax=Streptococcus bovimastitidis TaxID=1856638 RepID=A0A1L8MKB6_9STRE|nr:ImmA/IrrE family metallo-endopeptidase [Streptococcus bovimastitidis]OJF71217.1 cI-like repressor [Streptococcus bovimastitidis]